jgi:hypothetical protein
MYIWALDIYDVGLASIVRVLYGLQRKPSFEFRCTEYVPVTTNGEGLIREYGREYIQLNTEHVHTNDLHCAVLQGALKITCPCPLSGTVLLLSKTLSRRHN